MTGVDLPNNRPTLTRGRKGREWRNIISFFTSFKTGLPTHIWFFRCRTLAILFFIFYFFLGGGALIFVVYYISSHSHVLANLNCFGIIS